MASFFGFGRRGDDGGIPMASPSQPQPAAAVEADGDERRRMNSADRPPPISPHAPPPTHPSFSPTPALTSPPGSTSSVRRVARIDASSMPSIPNIHIFNPAENKTTTTTTKISNNNNAEEETTESDPSPEASANVSENVNEKGNTYDYVDNNQGVRVVEDSDHQPNQSDLSKPSMESYGASEEDQSSAYYQRQQQQQQQQQQSSGGYYNNGGYQTQYQHQQQPQQSQQDTLGEPTYSGSYATADSQSMDDHDDNNNYNNDDAQPRPIDSYEEDDDDDANHSYPTTHPAQVEENVDYDNYDAAVVAKDEDDRRQASPEILMDHVDDDDRQRAPANYNITGGSIGNGVRSVPSTFTPGSARKLIQRFRTPNRDLALTTTTTMTTAGAFSNGGKSPKSPLHEAIFTPKFKKIHDKAIRRRQDIQQNRQDLERRLAKLTAEMANNTMDREGHECHFLRDHICTPMVRASERLALEREYRTSPHYSANKHWLHFSARMSRLDRVMTLYDNVEVQNTMREELDLPYNELTQDVSPTFHLETIKAEKREGAMLRQFEGAAATAQRRYHEERASRYSSFEVVKQQLMAVVKRESDPARIEEAISKVKALRAKLEQERVERRMRDDHLTTMVEQDEISIKRAALEGMGGDDVISDVDALSVRRTIAY